jgi:hypothetical protein
LISFSYLSLNLAAISLLSFFRLSDWARGPFTVAEGTQFSCQLSAISFQPHPALAAPLNSAEKKLKAES